MRIFILELKSNIFRKYIIISDVWKISFKGCIDDNVENMNELKNTKDHEENKKSCMEQSCIVCGKVFPSLNEVLSHLNEHSEMDLGENSSNFPKQASTQKCTEINTARTDNQGNEMIDQDQPGFSKQPTNDNQESVLSLSTAHTGEKHYCCKLCDKAFTTRWKLTEHIRTHSGEKPYQCDICKKSFSTKGYMKIHLRTHTVKERYQCDVCKQSFAFKQYLKIHLRIHTGKECYQCKVCKKSFSTKQSLQVHMIVHTGKKPYQCDVCKYSFNSKHNLKRHIVIHSGEKPYQCEICKKSFTQKSYIKIHS